MKKLFHIIALALPLWGLGGGAFAQTIYVCNDGDYTTKTLSEGLEIDLTDTPDSITFSEPQMAKVVNIVYNGSTATVTIPSFMSSYVTCTSGTSSTVQITNTNTTDEVTYNVSGSSNSGSLIITADYKMTVCLNNVSLTSTLGEAMRFKCGKRIALVMANGSTNTFADTADGGLTPSASDNHKACIYTKGHLEISGAGTLNISGNYNHALASKEYLQVKSDVKAINIVKAANDAIHVGQYFQMSGGTLTIDGNTMGDGVQAEYETTTDASGNEVVVEDEENTGSIVISGGTFNITMEGSEDTKGMKADGDVNISGGTFVINANSNGSRGIQLDGDMTISEDDGTTTMTIMAAGAKCTNSEHSSDPHRCMGIKVGDADNSFGGNLTITGGTITVYNTGSKSKGIKVIGSYTRTGGTVPNEGSVVDYE